MQGSINRKIVVLSGLLTMFVLAAIVLSIALHQRRVQQTRAGAATVSSPAVGVEPARTARADVAASDRHDDEGGPDDEHRADDDRRGEHHDRRGHRHDRGRD